MNIIIPAAGQGSRFVNSAGYDVPKPYIKIGDEPMLRRVIDNLADPERDAVFVVARCQDAERLRATNILNMPHVVVKLLCEPTEGAPCTVIALERFIDPRQPLLIASCDQLIKFDRTRCLFDRARKDAIIFTFQSDEKLWSYANLDPEGSVISVTDRRTTGHHAACGVYWFGAAQYFFSAAREVITAQNKVRGEYRFPSVLNYLCNHIAIGVTQVDEMYSLGTPEDLVKNLPALRKWYDKEPESGV